VACPAAILKDKNPAIRVSGWNINQQEVVLK
jgi:hypothetical protein